MQALMQERIGKYIFEELEQAGSTFGIVTVTEVKLSSDISYVDVHVSCFKNADILTKTLAGYAQIIQKRLFKDLGLIKVPRVRFHHDDSGDTGQKLEEIINTLDSN